MTLALDLKRRLLLLLLVFIIGYFVFSVISAILLAKWGVASTPAMRILAMLQDIFLFIVPAILTAVIVTRQPAQLLQVEAKPPVTPLIYAVIALLVSVPAMNAVILLNEQLPLPDSLAQTLRQMEENAAAMVRALQGPHTVPNLIMSVLIVGVFAGFSEELLFRGCLQRLLSTGGVSAHGAIWIAAIVFSLLHMQFYGFVPRMLLGAFFGYALWWTRSLWTPVILHITNNTLYLVSEWQYGESSAMSTMGTDETAWYAIPSVILTVACLWAVRRFSRQPARQEVAANH